ncbi:HEAT repeat domain-containing protein [Labilibaculum manganireducens]|uniref:HEAT repeat domain-containing protein n=1 Tax=Labilibaculum manganireducens TaxID=1940525 RepID=UPI0029F5C1FA|nr:HEAT repeat domain-containing protein [Labilibaculum manganireducens]
MKTRILKIVILLVLIILIFIQLKDVLIMNYLNWIYQYLKNPDIIKSQVNSMRCIFEGPVVRALGNNQKSELSMFVISLMDPPPLKSLRRALKNRNATMKKNAAALLGYHKDKKSTDMLLNLAINDENISVRCKVIEAIGKIGDERAVLIISDLRTNDDPLIRISVAKALGEAKSVYAIKPLKDLLQDSNIEVRRYAVFGLGEIHSPETINGIIRALNDENMSVRIQAIRTLAFRRHEKAVTPLLILLNDPNKNVRIKTIYSLLEYKDERVTDKLINLLETSNDYDIIYPTVSALGYIGDKKALKPLIEKLSKCDNDILKRSIKNSINKIKRNNQ